MSRVSVGRVVLTASLVSLPLVVVALSSWRDITTVVLLGMMPALAVSPVSARSAARAIAPTAAVGLAATLLAAAGPFAPVLGTGLVVSLALWTAHAVPDGTATVRAVMIIIAAHLLVDPSGLLPNAASEPVVASAITVSVVLASAAGWIAGVFAMAVPGLPGSPGMPEPAARPSASAPYGVLLATVCGGLTLVCMLWCRGTEMWWTVLTAALVLLPDRGGTTERAAHRVVGTLIGIGISSVASTAPPAVLDLVGVIAGCACAVLSARRAPYWMFTAAVTTAVLTLTFTGSQMLGADAERLGATVGAAGACVAAWSIWRMSPRRSGGGRP